MKRKITLTSRLFLLIKTLFVILMLTMAACSTVRDVTDWVPGVDSNEEIQAEKEKRAREVYTDKAVFTSTGTDTVSEADAKISVRISQKYREESAIKPEDIGIEVSGGVVTLTGSVDSDESAIRAIALAKSTRGVAKVISRLVVIKLRTQ